MNMKCLTPVVIAFSSLISSAAISATLIGDTVVAEYYYPNQGTVFSSDSFVVGAGVEASCPGTSGICDTLIEPYTLDFGANTIRFDQTGTNNAYQSTAFNGWVFTDLDFGAGIGDVSLSFSGLPGLSDSDLTFTSDSITLNLANVGNVGDPNYWELTITEVPIPAAAWLFGSAVIGLVGMKRKQHS